MSSVPTESYSQSFSSRRMLDRLRAGVGDEGMLCKAEQRLVYECDGFVVEKRSPDVVVFPVSTEQVVAIVRLCHEFDVPFVPRGAGTSLAGGCLPVGGGVMIALTRMKQILEVNFGQCASHESSQGERISLCSRPFQPRGMYHRRQFRHQFRWASHIEIRRDCESCAGG